LREVAKGSRRPPGDSASQGDDSPSHSFRISARRASHASPRSRIATLKKLKGERSTLESFAFTAAFEPNTNEFAISNIDPPLEVGTEYLVFLDDGKVVFPGGNYRVANGRVWNIGHWLSADARVYPDDLSGLSVAEATREIRAALATP
jgi:hypothetical protein